ncbi:hypothetical protein BDR22DRAFT_966651 [Usnea florida]
MNSELSTASWDSTGASFLATPFFTSSSPVRIDTGQYRVLFTFRVCLPGESNPWYGTKSRQEAKEEFFLDFQYTKAKEHVSSENGDVGYPYPTTDPLTNFTRRCRSSTTLGYFELPNSWNNHSAGPLDEGCFNLTLGCPELDASKDEDGFTSSLSPLNVSIAAIFGDELGQPFTRLTASAPNNGLWGFNSSFIGCQSSLYRPGKLAEIMYDWLINFRDLDSITTALSLTMSLSDKAMMNQDLTEFIGNDIYNPPGYGIMKPSMSKAAMILLSILILIQLLGLCFLAHYAHSGPT